MAVLLEDRINELQQRVEKMKEEKRYFYLKSIEGASGPRVTIDGREMLMFASYNYLGLITHPKIKKAAIDAIEKYGTGAAGVRLLAGTTKIHEELEAKIAEFKGAEDAVTYSSGYVTNLAAISTLCGRGDLVIIDKLDHASIIDGCLLSGATHRSYLHNNMESLERILSNSGRYINKLIIVDAVYSMDGDVSNLPEISRLAKKYNAKVMVDEAHSIGVLGKTGHGIEEHFGLKDAVDIHMGTLSKTIPSIGGYLAGDKDLINFLKHHSRPFIFSASLPPVAAATAIACFEVIESEPERIINLQKNVKQFKDGLNSMGYNTMNSTTSIVPILVGEEEDTLKLCQVVNDEGIFICPILFPAIPKGTNRLRAHVLATHTSEDIDKALDIFKRAGKKLGLIT
ncbi:pyridoxal phosphate-dependent aminotransferase family protein [Candidatus Atribacteria bacterium MT.SAG.1]|nr:pyridoxal phosphate-dependent aminotransferase family protein [Candidatus Atribacteria bacterium MT.SAG.1]